MADKEVEIEEEDDLVIEIEDDTPEEDKGKHKAADDEPETDLPDEEELKNYADAAAKRIRQLTKKYHDERRSKEDKGRQLDAAVNTTKTVLTEADRLKKQLAGVSKVAVSAHKSQYEGEVKSLKEQLASAIDLGEGTKVADLTEKLSEAKSRLMGAERAEEQIKTRPEDDKGTDVPQEDAADKSKWPKVRQKWAKNNSWFGQDGNEEMTAVAYGMHTKLVKSGIEPDTEEYFEKIDSRIRELFPEEFEDEDEEEEEVEPKQKKGRKASERAAPVNSGVIKTRMKDGKKVYVLNESQVGLCKKLGISHKEYIEQVQAKGAE